MPHSCESVFPKKEGGIQVLAGLAPSSQTVGSFNSDSSASKAQLMNDKQTEQYFLSSYLAYKFA